MAKKPNWTLLRVEVAGYYAQLLIERCHTSPESLGLAAVEAELYKPMSEINANHWPPWFATIGTSRVRDTSVQHGCTCARCETARLASLRHRLGTAIRCVRLSTGDTQSEATATERGVTFHWVDSDGHPVDRCDAERRFGVLRAGYKRAIVESGAMPLASWLADSHTRIITAKEAETLVPRKRSSKNPVGFQVPVPVETHRPAPTPTIDLYAFQARFLAACNVLEMPRPADLDLWAALDR